MSFRTSRIVNRALAFVNLGAALLNVVVFAIYHNPLNAIVVPLSLGAALFCWHVANDAGKLEKQEQGNREFIDHHVTRF